MINEWIIPNITNILFFQTIWMLEKKTDVYKLSNIFTLWGSLGTAMFSTLYMITEKPILIYMTHSMFITHLLFELVYGCVYFPQHMNLYTTYIHHFLYLFLEYKLIESDIFKGTVCMLLEEAPTFLLNCKRYFKIKNKHFELLYGTSFILIRIIYQVFLYFKLHQYIMSDVFYVAIFNISLCAHCKWGYMWIHKYIKMSHENNRSKSHQSNQVTPTPPNQIQTIDDYSIGENIIYLCKGILIYGSCMLASQALFVYSSMKGN